MSSSNHSLLTPSKGKTTVSSSSSSSPSPHVARPTAAIIHGQWKGTIKETENKWNVSSLSSTLGISPTPTPTPTPLSTNKKYQHVQSKLYSPTTASIHNQASPRPKVNDTDDNISVHSRFTTSSISPKAVGSPTQDTSRWTKSVLNSVVDPISYQYRSSRNVNDSLNGNIEDDSLSVVSRLTSASKKYADVPSRLHQPTTASIHARHSSSNSHSNSSSPRPTSSPAVKSAPMSASTSTSIRPSTGSSASAVKTSSGVNRAPDSGRHVTSTIQSQHHHASSSAVPNSQGSKFIDIVKVEDELSALNIAPSPKVGASGLRISKPAVPSFVSVDAPAASTKSVVSDLGSSVVVGTVGDRIRRTTESSSSQPLDLEEEEETY